MSEIMIPDNATEIVKARKFGGVTALTADDIGRRGMVLSVCGPGGTRKTTFAGTGVESEYGRPMHIIDMNGNAHVLPFNPERFVTTVTSCDQVDRIMTDYESGYQNDIKLVVFDHCSALYDDKLNGGDKKKDGGISIAAYNIAQSWLLSLARRCITLSERPPYCSFLFIFQETTEERVQEDENGIPQIIKRREINLSNKAQGMFPSIVPFMGFMRYGLNKPPWPTVLDFRPAWHTQAKFQPRGGMLEYLDKLPLEMWNPSIATLLDTMVGGQPWPKGKHDRP
jgi:hypothetical protein